MGIDCKRPWSRHDRFLRRARRDHEIAEKRARLRRGKQGPGPHPRDEKISAISETRRSRRKMRRPNQTPYLAVDPPNGLTDKAHAPPSRTPAARACSIGWP